MKTAVWGALLAIAAAAPAAALHAQADTTEHQAPPRAVQPAPPNLVGAVRIIGVADGGTFITLEDSTEWEVYLPDRTSSVTWRPGDAVILRLRNIVVGDHYDFELFDGRTDSRAAVKFRGLRERAAAQ
ncbi:MAG: hypothetical protein IRY91_07405 [Gemmatimonadaceae bacterium]|nr:hypothetical protein [Gemmatimonadaceae bacterium]